MADEVCDSLDVYAREWETIRERRRGAEPPRGLSGLALSGGGIRSATFNLGVLQSLNRGGILGDFDYLSTVSGGGYIGGWWSCWLSRSAVKRRGVFPDEEGVETWRHQVRDTQRRKAAAATPKPDPVHHVRLFSNYLTPRKGALSRDLWRAITVIARNIVLTWAALIPLLAMGVVLAYAGFLALYGSPASGAARLWAVASLPLAFLGWFALLSTMWLLLQRGGTRGQWFITTVSLGAIAQLIMAEMPFGEGGFYEPSVIVAAVFMIAASVQVLWSGRCSRYDDLEVFRNRLAQIQSVALVAATATAVIGAAVAYGPQLVERAFTADLIGPMNADRYAAWSGWATLIGSIVSAIYAARKGAPAGGADAIPRQKPSRISRLLLGVAPSLVVITLVFTLVWLSHWATSALVGWGRVLGHAALVGAFAMAFYAAMERPHPSTPLVLVFSVVAALLSGAFLTAREIGDPAIPLALAALSGVTIVAWRVFGRSKRGDVRLDRSLQLLIAGAVLLFGVPALRMAEGTMAEPVRLLLGVAALLFTTVILIGWTTDPNRLSMHTFYKMRLVRAYLGASNPNRVDGEAEDITESKPGDDVLLSQISRSDGPYHLINGTLNMTTGTDLVIAQRAAAPFLFSRHFCGSARTGFRPTERYRAGSITLGTAVAISGAAASPVMGSQTPSTAMSMLLAMLNVRLGYWVPTPSGMDWEAPQARFWPFYLLREFFSHIADTGSHCYVTDGGHFDNTGVYSLVERGCQTIVLTDCGADPDTVFDDIANLVRRCRIDFGAEITFPTLAPFSRATLAADRTAYVEGRIVYKRTHLNAIGWNLAEHEPVPEGTLLVIKPTLVATLETDVNRYSQQYADFPQQTTADQWFDEAQFESYRRLGEKSGSAALSRLPTPLRLRPASAPVSGSAPVTVQPV